MDKIKIEQLDQGGLVFRTFNQQADHRNLDVALDRIARGFNLDHTRVTVNGVVLPGVVGPNGA
jgi:hypothetical protein